MAIYTAVKDFSSLELGKVKKGAVVAFNKQWLASGLIVEQKETKTK